MNAAARKATNSSSTKGAARVSGVGGLLERLLGVRASGMLESGRICTGSVSHRQPVRLLPPPRPQLHARAHSVAGGERVCTPIQVLPDVVGCS